MRFTGLLYKVADQAKYRKPQNGRQQSTESRQTLEGHSQASPIDLTNDDNGNTAVIRGLTPNTSVCSRRPASSHMSASQASNGAMFFGNQDSAITSRRPSLALPAYRSPAVSQIWKELDMDMKNVKLTGEIVPWSWYQVCGRLLHHGGFDLSGRIIGSQSDIQQPRREHAADGHHARHASGASSGPQAAEAEAARDAPGQVPSYLHRHERRARPSAPYCRSSRG
jgi:hypothetical protein